MPKKIKCPKCSKSDYSVQNQGGSVTTFLHCKSCGYSATEEAWTAQQEDKSASSNPFYGKRNLKKIAVEELGENKYYQSFLNPGQFIALRTTEDQFQQYDFLDGMLGGDRYSKEEDVWEPQVPDEDSLNGIFLTNRDKGIWVVFNKHSQALHFLENPIEGIEVLDVGYVNSKNSKEYKETSGENIEKYFSSIYEGPKDSKDSEDSEDSEDIFSKNNLFYKKSESDDNLECNKKYNGQWKTCKCGKEYEVGVNGDSRFCNTCLEQEKMTNRIKTKRSPLAKGNPFYKKAEKIISMWINPKYKNKIFKQVESPDGVQFSDDGGDTWLFTMRTPEEIEKMGFEKIKSEKTEDQKERAEMERMGFDDEMDWENFKDYFAKKNPYYKLSQSTSVGDDKKPASDEPKEKNKSENPNQRGFNKKPRKNPERAFDAKQDPDEVRRVSMQNPFYKLSEKDKKYKNKKEKTYLEKGLSAAVDEVNEEEKKVSSANPFYSQAKSNKMKEDKGNKCPCSATSKKEENKMKGLKGPVGPKGPKKADEKMVEPVKSYAGNNPFYKKSNEFQRIPSKEQEATILLDELIQAIDETRDFNSLDMRGTVLSRLKTIRALVKTDEIEEKTENLPEGFSDDFKSQLNDIFQSFIDKGLDNKTAAKKAIQKFAREFSDRSEHGKKMKELSDNNMVYPEDPMHDRKHNLQDEKGQNKNIKKNVPGGESSNLDEMNPSYEWNTVDRKEYRSSPKPWDFDPGYKDWYDREIDKYYDGWLDDHIENAGGSVPGSNQQKTMNLNEGERAHAPEFPIEAIYEKLLESRHEFNDDYVKVVAKGKTYVFKRAEAEEIVKLNFHDLLEEVSKILIKNNPNRTPEDVLQYFLSYYDMKSKNPVDIAQRIERLININAGEIGPVFDLKQEKSAFKKKSLKKKSSTLGLHIVQT